MIARLPTTPLPLALALPSDIDTRFPDSKEETPEGRIVTLTS